MNKVFALIPARSGSKGVKDKNIKNLAGHSLLEWSIKAAQNSKLIDRVFISTDSEEYAKIGRSFGAEVPFLRPKTISGDSSTDLEFLKHAIDEFKKLDLYPELIAHIRPTTPIRDPDIIDEAILLFQKSQDKDSLRSVHIMSESSYKTLEINNGFLTPLSFFANQNLDTNAPRQSFPNTYQANGYIDILLTEFILEKNEIHGTKILPFITRPAYEVDSIDDFEYLEFLATKSPGIIKKLFK